MQFVWWLTGVMATMAAIRFVWLVFRRLTSKENMSMLLDKATVGATRTAHNVGDYFKKRAARKKEENRPVVTIH